MWRWKHRQARNRLSPPHYPCQHRSRCRKALRRGDSARWVRLAGYQGVSRAHDRPTALILARQLWREERKVRMHGTLSPDRVHPRYPETRQFPAPSRLWAKASHLPLPPQPTSRSHDASRLTPRLLDQDLSRVPRNAWYPTPSSLLGRPQRPQQMLARVLGPLIPLVLSQLLQSPLG